MSRVTASTALVVRLYHIYCLFLIQYSSWSVREGNEIGLTDFFLENPNCVFLITLSLRSLKIDCLIICFIVFLVIESRGLFFTSFWLFLPFLRTGTGLDLLSPNSSFSLNSQWTSIGSLYTVQWPPTGLANLRASDLLTLFDFFSPWQYEVCTAVLIFFSSFVSVICYFEGGVWGCI